MGDKNLQEIVYRYKKIILAVGEKKARGIFNGDKESFKLKTSLSKDICDKFTKDYEQAEKILFLG